MGEGAHVNNKEYFNWVGAQSALNLTRLVLKHFKTSQRGHQRHPGDCGTAQQLLRLKGNVWHLKVCVVFFNAAINLSNMDKFTFGWQSILDNEMCLYTRMCVCVYKYI